MNLGEKIYDLRFRNGMSQEALADKLGVSRQAVSKWENNSAVPDIDKLLKMSEFFGVSLDELVKGEKIEKVTEDTSEEAVPVVIKQSLPMRKVVGIVLFCMAFITALAFFILGGFEAMIYAVPFALFGCICIFCEKHTGLKCLWSGNFMLIAFTALTMGITATTVRYTFEWTQDMNYGSLAIAWALAVFNVFVIIRTAIKLGNEPVKFPEKAKNTLIISFISVAAVFIVNHLLSMLSASILQDMLLNGEHSYTFSLAFKLLSVFKHYMIEIVLAFALTSAIRYIRLMRNKNMR